MALHIDIENKKLVQSITSDRSVSTPVFMQGDKEPLEIFLLEKGEETIFSPKALTVGNDFLRVAIARFKGYPKSLTYTSGYTLNPNGGAEVLLPLNTKDIEIALQEQEYISAFLEVEYKLSTVKPFATAADKIVPLIFAPVKSAPVSVALKNLLPSRFWSLKFQPLKLFPSKLIPDIFFSL